MKIQGFLGAKLVSSIARVVKEQRKTEMECVDVAISVRLSCGGGPMGDLRVQGYSRRCRGCTSA
jgi:hypothetical protein